MRETIFPAMANNLSRLRIYDSIRRYLHVLAGMRIEGKCLLWGPMTIRPIGGVRNIAIGAGRHINSNTRFGVPREPVTIAAM